MPIDIAWLRAEKGGDPSRIRESELRRGRDGKLVDEVIAVDNRWRDSTYEMEMLKKDLNAVNKAIGLRKKKDRTDACADLLENVSKLKEKIPLAEEAAAAASIKRDALLKKIGNVVQQSVVTSTDEADNAILRTWKPEERPAPEESSDAPSGCRSHHELMLMLDMVDLKRGAELAGHRGYFLKGPGVTLNWALVQYGMSFLRQRGYTPVQPPYFMRKEIMAETAELADFDESLYKIPMGKGAGGEANGEAKKTGADEAAATSYDLFLIATSEQPISALHRNEYVEPKALPFRYAGISTCFRKEAGAHGKDMAGIFRVHQFEKVEQFVLTTPEESNAMHEEMISLAEDFYKTLKLPYRVVSIVSGALNDAASKKYDLEAWFPSYNAYRELVSCSNCLDYQARALNVRLGHPKMGDREKKFVHMLNSTLVASERTMCCILENYQREDGIEVPEVLAPFMDNQTLIPFLRTREQK